jgi:hypothetical protein
MLVPGPTVNQTGVGVVLLADSSDVKALARLCLDS